MKGIKSMEMEKLEEKFTSDITQIVLLEPEELSEGTIQ